jgi:predicted P-loop ATPase
VSLNDALLNRAHLLLPDWLPGGDWRGHEYVCADLSGGEGSSLSVNSKTGVWADFSGDDKGSDLVSLYAAIHNLGQAAAARELMQMLGWEQEQASAHRPSPSAAPKPAAPAPELADKARRKSLWRAIVPVPGHAPMPKFRWGYKDKTTGEWHELLAVDFWEYAFEQQRLGYVARFHRTNSKGEPEKETIPFTWCVDESDGRGTMKWHPKQWEAPRPLYVPAAALGDPARKPVVLVEGEKCARAGHDLLGAEFDFVTWPGGTKAWALAHWGWLMGRTVIMWPDADAKRARLTAAEREAGVDPATKPLLPPVKQPGLQAMLGIGQLLQAKQACTVHLVAMLPPGERPDGWDIADAIADGWDAARVRDYIRAATPFIAPEDAVRAATGSASTPSRAAAGGGEDADDDGTPGWMRYLLSSATGTVRPVRENIVLALDGWPDRGVPGIPACQGLIRFNEFSNNVEKSGPTPWGTPAGDWLEADELLMGDWLVRQHQMPSFPRQQLEEAVIIVARRHGFHPMREKLVGLRGRWDRTNRLDTWLRRCCLEEDEWGDADPLQRYLTLVGRWFVMGMCARVLPEVRQGGRVVIGPGTKFDYMLVFEGPQGWGKSSLAAVLGGDYFADTGLDINNKDSLMNIQGILVYEWSELENLNKQEVGAVKRFISSPSDRFRATFDRRPAKYPRQVVFVGTTNESHYLTDPTGNRRFWPVRVTQAPDLAWLRENLEQLLAEAVHRVEAGERFWPDRDEQRDLFDPQQLARTVESSLESSIVDYLYNEQQKVPMGQSNGSLLPHITMVDLLSRVGYTLDKQTDAVVKKAGAILHKLGWEPSKRLASNDEGRRPRAYVRPPPGRSRQGAGASQASADSNTNRPTQGKPPAGADDDDCPF